MAATLIILAKLFATALMTATCSNIFFAATRQLIILQRKVGEKKNGI
jgi:hypothetical protein